MITLRNGSSDQSPIANISNSTSSVVSNEIDPSDIIVGIILSCVIVITVFGNSLVFRAVFTTPTLRSKTNYLVVNLAVADTFLGILVLPLSATHQVLGTWPFGKVICHFWTSVDVLCCTASILTLCVISIDRYIAVTRPLRQAKIMTERRIFYLIALVWVISTGISAVGMLFTPPKDIPDNCQVDQGLTYTLVSCSISFYLPSLVMLSIYFRIYREVAKRNKAIERGRLETKEQRHLTQLRIHRGCSNNSESSRIIGSSKGSMTRPRFSFVNIESKHRRFLRESKAAKTLGIVVGVFFLCWMPFFVIHPVNSACLDCVPPLLFQIVFWLGYCNSMLNPLIYTCSSKDFRNAFRRILNCPSNEGRARQMVVLLQNKSKKYINAYCQEQDKDSNVNSENDGNSDYGLL